MLQINKDNRCISHSRWLFMATHPQTSPNPQQRFEYLPTIENKSAPITASPVAVLGPFPQPLHAIFKG